MLLAHSDLQLIPELSVCKRAQEHKKSNYVLNNTENVHLQVTHSYTYMCTVKVCD